MSKPVPSTTRKTRRAADGAVASRGPGRGRVQPLHEALSGHALVPRVQNPSPSHTSKQQRFLQVLARHLARDDPWIRNLVRVLCDLHIGVGPKPKSRYPRLVELWLAHQDRLDNRGDFSFPDLLREIYRNRIVDGESWVRIRSRLGTALGDGLVVPLQLQALQSEFVPIDFEQTVGARRFVCGVARTYDRVVAYAVYREHPGESMVYERPMVLPAGEMLHVCERRLGAPRGEVPLASALMRAIKAATLEDAELRRKMVASLMSVFVTRPVDASDDEIMIPTPDEVADMIDGISLSPGGVFELPYGYKMESFEPKDEPQNFEKALRWNLMAVCAAVGVPPHEVTGDWNSLPERMARYVGQSMERRAQIEQGTLQFQLLDPAWRAFVDHCIADGLWEPPADVDMIHAYSVEWEWPLLPLASFRQELAVMMNAEEKGIISKEYVTKTMFGLEPAHVDRERVRENARKLALGLQSDPVAWEPTTELGQLFADEAEEIERADWALGD